MLLNKLTIFKKKLTIKNKKLKIFEIHLEKKKKKCI